MLIFFTSDTGSKLDYQWCEAHFPMDKHFTEILYQNLNNYLNNILHKLRLCKFCRYFKVTLYFSPILQNTIRKPRFIKVMSYSSNQTVISERAQIMLQNTVKKFFNMPTFFFNLQPICGRLKDLRIAFSVQSALQCY